MGGDKFSVFVLGVFVLGVFAFAFSFVGFNMPMTGYVIFGDSNYSDFAGGVFSDTEWNGSAVVLFGDNLSGSFESRVFDSGIVAGASWNNLSYVGVIPSLEILLAVDGTADVWESMDSGVSWEMVKDDYNGGDGNGATYMVGDDSGNLFVLHNQDLWGSVDMGNSWTKVNDDFNLAGDSNNGLVIEARGDDIFIVDGSKEVLRSTDSGISFVTVSEDFGGATNAKGMTSDGSDNLYIVDGSADVWSSNDSGANWVLVKDDYNGGNGNDASDMSSDSSGNLFILHNQDLWKSTDSGVSWVLENDDFNGGSDSHSGQIVYFGEDNDIYVIDGAEDVWKSTDSGVSFSLVVSNLNGANGNIFGFSSEVSFGNLSFEVRNCSVSDCSDGAWQSVDSGVIDLSGRYAQYRVDFSSPGVESSPSLATVSIDYDLMNSAPSVSLNSPENWLYDYNNSLALDYVVADEDDNIDSCWYEIDSDGVVPLVGCLNVTFNSSYGVHNLTVYVNDSFGESDSDSVSFRVDVDGVEIVLSEPVGEKGSRTGIPISYSVVGADECWYNVETSIGGGVIGNTSLVSCNGSSFDVSVDGDYVLNLFANNSLGSFAFESSVFLVDSSEDILVDNGGSSGGGGGSYVSPGSSAKLKIEPIYVVASLGEERSLLASVKNNGKVAANKCVLGGGDYIDSDFISNIGVGEIVEFAFVLSILDFDVENLSLDVVCLEGIVGEVPLEVLVLKPTLDVSVDEISFGPDGGLLTKYNIDPTYSSNYVLSFKIFDSDGNLVAEIYEEVGVVVGEIYEGEILFDLSGVDEGMLRVLISDENDVSLVEEDFIYYGSSRVVGFALVNMKGNGSYVWSFITLSLLVLLGWRVRKLYKK